MLSTDTIARVILNIGSLRSYAGYGKVCEKAECLFRCRFFSPLTTEKVFNEIKTCLYENGFKI